MQFRHVLAHQSNVLELTFTHDLLLDTPRPSPRLCFHLIAWRAVQLLPDTRGDVVGQILARRRGIQAKNELHPWVSRPAIQMLGLAEIGVATQEYTAKTSL